MRKRPKFLKICEVFQDVINFVLKSSYDILKGHNIK